MKPSDQKDKVLNIYYEGHKGYKTLSMELTDWLISIILPKKAIYLSHNQ